MSEFNVSEVLESVGVHTDVSGKWVNITDVEKLINGLVLKCAQIADDNSRDSIGDMIKKEFNLLSGK
jgi:hypothetical protein